MAATTRPSPLHDTRRRRATHALCLIFDFVATHRGDHRLFTTPSSLCHHDLNTLRRHPHQPLPHCTTRMSCQRSPWFSSLPPPTTYSEGDPQPHVCAPSFIALPPPTPIALPPSPTLTTRVELRSPCRFVTSLLPQAQGSQRHAMVIDYTSIPRRANVFPATSPSCPSPYYFDATYFVPASATMINFLRASTSWSPFRHLVKLYCIPRLVPVVSLRRVEDEEDEGGCCPSSLRPLVA